jgi:hypothetical protein
MVLFDQFELMFVIVVPPLAVSSSVNSLPFSNPLLDEVAFPACNHWSLGGIL